MDLDALRQLTHAELAHWIRRNPRRAQALRQSIYWARVKLARVDPNEFCELVLRDEKTAAAIVQAPIHEEFQRLTLSTDRLLLWGFIESGKALPLATRVPSPDGWVTMGELVPGHRVFGGAGEVSVVTGVSRVQHDRACYRITFDDGASIVADADHLWLAADLRDRVKRRERVVTTADLAKQVWVKTTAGRQSNWRMRLPGAVQYPERELPVHPYVLGAWLGDGNTANAGLTFHDHDRWIFDRCQQLEGGSCVPKAKPGTRVYRGTLGGRTAHAERRQGGASLRGRLKRLGVIGNKHIPEEYLLASEAQRRQLLAGLLDTDGSVASNGRVEFCSALACLADQTLELVRSLGLKAKISESDAKLNGRVTGKRYRVTFTAQEVVFTLPRKVARQRLGLRGTRAEFRYVTEVSEVPSVPVKCISVSTPDRTYLVSNAYLVTHNTQQIAIAHSLWELGRNPRLRFIVGSATSRYASKLVAAVRSYIERPGPLHDIFPNLRPGSTWSQTVFTLDLPGKGVPKDPTMQATGVGTTSILGTRADRVLLDDILNPTNTKSPNARDQVKSWYYQVPKSRLDQVGKIRILGNAFHPEDLMHDLAATGEFTWRKFPVMVDGKSVWPERWPQERIDRQRGEVSAHEFARMLLCVPRDESEARFKREWIDKALHLGRELAPIHTLEAPPHGCRVYTGVDLAVSLKGTADLTVFATIMLRPDGVRQLLWVEAGRWAAQDIVSRAEEHYKRYRSILIVESNAAQDYLRQFIADKDIPVRAHTTTSQNKTSVEFGVEGIATEMANSKWAIPSLGGKPATKEMDTLVAEMLYYDPRQHTGDRLMALWIAREGSRVSSGDIMTGTKNMTGPRLPPTRPW